MRYYHMSYSNVNAFTMSPKQYDDVDINGKRMDTPRISLSDSPERGIRGFVDAGPLEYGRLKGHTWMTVYVYVTNAPTTDVIPHHKLRGKIFDVNVTHESWYVGTQPLEFTRIGAMGIAMSLNDRVVIKYRDYGLASEPLASRVYGNNIKRTRMTLPAGVLRRGMGDESQQTDTTRSTGDWSVSVMNNDGYIPDRISETYASVRDVCVGVFDYIGLMNYEIIRLSNKETYRYLASNKRTGESATFVLDTVPTARKLVDSKIVPNVIWSNA